MTHARRTGVAAALACALLLSPAVAVPAHAAPAAAAVALPHGTTAVLAGAATSPSAPVPPRDPRNIGVLVNKTHPLSPKSYVPRGLVRVQGHRLRAEPARALKAMMAAARKAGAPLVTVSGYRSYATQKALFARYSRLYGVAYASRISARPGYSEHQTGLTMDVGAAHGGCRLGTCFGNTKAGRWVAANAWRYGYIVRYPRGQEKVTGYSYEPWHLRYVGVKISTAMKKAKIPTLEHYYGQVRRG